MAILKHQ